MLTTELNYQEILDGIISSVCDYEIAKIYKNIPQVDILWNAKGISIKSNFQDFFHRNQKINSSGVLLSFYLIIKLS